jgi:hypothetical protein
METPNSTEVVVSTRFKKAPPIKKLQLKRGVRFNLGQYLKGLTKKAKDDIKKEEKREKQYKKTRKYRTDRASVELAIDQLKSETEMISNPVIDEYVPTSEVCNIPFRITQHRNPYQITTIESTAEVLLNFVYFQESCLKNLVKGNNKRNVLVSYIKNIIFLETFHTRGIDFENTVPVLGYGLLTNKSDYDFMYEALRVLIQEGGRENIGMIEALIGQLPRGAKLANFAAYFGFEQGTGIAEKLANFSKHASIVLTQEDVLVAQKLLGTESITFQQILSIAHSVESLMILILVDLYCRIEYIETHFIYKVDRDKLRGTINQIKLNEVSNKLAHRAEGGHFKGMNYIPLLTPQEEYQLQKKSLMGRYPGRAMDSIVKNHDAKYKQLNTDSLNYYCMDLFLRPPAYRFEKNAKVNVGGGLLDYYRYAIDFSKVSFEFDDSPRVDVFKTKINFPNKEYYTKALTILQEVFSFTFNEGVEPLDKTRYYPSFRIHKSSEDIYLELSIQKSSITKYFDEYIEPAMKMKSETIKSPNVIEVFKDPTQFGARIGTAGIEIESEADMEKRGYLVSKLKSFFKGPTLAILTSLGLFATKAFGLDNIDQVSELLKQFANDFKIRYKKDELLFNTIEPLLAQSKATVENVSPARRNARAFHNALMRNLENANAGPQALLMLQAGREVIRSYLPSATKEIDVYTKKPLPESARPHYKNFDIVHDIFPNRYYPKTKVPQLLDSDVKFALLASAAYIPNMKRNSDGHLEVINKDLLKVIRYKDTELHYLSIFTEQKSKDGLPTLDESFQKQGIFNPRDFLDENGIENIRFYYELPKDFKDIVGQLATKYSTLETSTRTLKQLATQIKTTEESLQKASTTQKKLKEEVEQKVIRQQNLRGELEENEKEYERELQKVQDKLRTELEERVVKLQEKIEELKSAKSKTTAEKELKKLTIKIEKLEKVIATVEGDRTRTNSLAEDTPSLKQLAEQIDEKEEKLKSIETYIRDRSKLLSIYSGKVKNLTKDLEIFQGNQKKEKVKIIKTEIQPLIENLRNPFHLFIAYRGTEFDSQQIRDLMVADVLLAIGKDELDPRFTIVNRITSNINLFRRHIADKINREVLPVSLPNEIREYFMNKIRLQIYSTGHSLGGTLALMSTYYSYINPIPETLRQYVGNVILSVGFNAGAGVPITKKFQKLPENSFRIYRNHGDIISFCLKYYQNNFINKKNIINVPTIHSTKLEDTIKNHGMTNFLGLELYAKLYGMEITPEMINRITYEHPLIFYGKGKDPRVPDEDIFQKVSLYPASRQIEADFTQAEERKRQYDELTEARKRQNDELTKARRLEEEEKERKRRFLNEEVHHPIGHVLSFLSGALPYNGEGGGTRKHRRSKSRLTRRHR